MQRVRLEVTDDQIFFKYHRAADNENTAKFIAFKRNPDAYWFGDYEEAVSEFSVIN